MVARVYSYIRFSDPRQATGHSSERQADYAAKWAADNGLVLDESLSLRDEGLSAYHQHHIKSGALGAFLAAIEHGKISPGSVLVVEGLDRLSRAEPIQAQAQLAQIVNAGITVVTASDGKAYSRDHLKANPMDLIHSLIIMIRAHEESETKSKRVKASIRKLCQAWQAGTYRGLIRNGKDPQWLRLTPDKTFEPIPERVDALRLAIDLYTRGYGASQIVDTLYKQGMRITDAEVSPSHIYRLIKLRSLVGEKEIEVDAETFRLENYYPAVITQAQWDDMRTTAATRSRTKIKGKLPTVLTGHGFTNCGYCGSPIVSQTMTGKARTADGLIRDCHARIRCLKNFQTADRLRCMGGGSCSVAPIERAVINYCTDLLNLRGLYGHDRAAGPRAELARLNQQIADLEAKLDRLTTVMLESADDGVPQAFAKRARAMEADLDDLRRHAKTADTEVGAATRLGIDGADQAWRDVAEGVARQDFDARLRARQLVRDTFEQITIYWRGLRPADDGEFVDVTLVAKGGTSRHLRIDKSGNWLAAEDTSQAMG